MSLFGDLDEAIKLKKQEIDQKKQIEQKAQAKAAQLAQKQRTHNAG